LQHRQHTGCVPVGPEEELTQVVVDSVDRVTLLGKVKNSFCADQTAASGYDEFHSDAFLFAYEPVLPLVASS
jgi:hypothetical protein